MTFWKKILDQNINHLFVCWCKWFIFGFQFHIFAHFFHFLFFVLFLDWSTIDYNLKHESFNMNLQNVMIKFCKIIFFSHVCAKSFLQEWIAKNSNENSINVSTTFYSSSFQSKLSVFVDILLLFVIIFFCSFLFLKLKIIHKKTKGVEYSFGGHEGSHTGVFRIPPRSCSGVRSVLFFVCFMCLMISQFRNLVCNFQELWFLFQICFLDFIEPEIPNNCSFKQLFSKNKNRFRESVEVGKTTMTQREIQTTIEKLSDEFVGNSYHLLQRNCNHFSDALCRQLTGYGIPNWINRYKKEKEIRKKDIKSKTNKTKTKPKTTNKNKLKQTRMVWFLVSMFSSTRHATWTNSKLLKPRGRRQRTFSS